MAVRSQKDGSPIPSEKFGEDVGGSHGKEGSTVKPVPRLSCAKMWCRDQLYKKDQFQSAHMPSLFVQLEPEDRALGNTHRQRLNGLTQLARSLLGPNATPHTLMNHVNSRLKDIIHAWANIWVPLQLDMKAWCKFARWQIPEKFEIFPQVNSPACLVYWRIFVYLLGQLPNSPREEFFPTYHQGQSPSCTTNCIPDSRKISA